MLLGWRCIYTPAAVAYHVRSVTPGNRALGARGHQHALGEEPLPDAHQERHRRRYRRYWLPMTLRDLVVVGGTLLREPRSLPAFWRLAQCLPRALRQRREIMRKRRVDDRVLADWFSFTPIAQPDGRDRPGAHRFPVPGPQHSVVGIRGLKPGLRPALPWRHWL